MTPEQLFGDLLAAEPSRPFVTYYDEATGERSELSVRSLANWVAKTHFLLIDELGLGAGDAAYVAMPAHWLSVSAVLGCLTAGLSLTSDPADAAVAFVSPATVGTATGVPDVYSIAPAVDATDYATAVRPQPDAWSSVRPGAGPSDPCFDARSRADVVADARARAAELGIGEGARLLTTRDWTGPAEWLDLLVLPVVMGGSVVYVRNAAEDVVARRMQQERATVRL